MKCYPFDVIKEQVAISTYLRDKGVEVKHGRFPAFWRGSADLNCSVNSDDKAFYDHVEKSGGSVIDLCMIVEGYELPHFAANALGDRYNCTGAITPKVLRNENSSRYDELIRNGYTLTVEYNYTDEDGKLLYTVQRLEHPEQPKQFLQKTPDHYGISDVRRVLYNLPAVIKSPTVYIVEGEKDATTLIKLGLCATTNNGGAKNWLNDFNRFFQGKEVIILADNDDAGELHAQHVVKQINDYVSSIKVLTPSTLPKGDVTDYLEKENGTLQSLLAKIEATPYINRQAESAKNAQYTIAEARERNQRPFANYTEEWHTDDKGKNVCVEIPIRAIDLVEDCRRRFLDFPRRLGNNLFDHSPKTGNLIYLPNPDSLFAWIQIASKQTVQWSRVRGSVSHAQFFQALFLSVRAYDGTAKAPHYPLRSEIYYTNKPLPTVDPTAPSKLDELVARFTPATPVYGILIKALFMAPMFFGGRAPRPAWVIDSIDGKGVGKTTLVKIVSELYDEAPIDIDVADIKNDLTAIVKRLISADGRSKRIALLDNVQGNFKSANLARLITQATISGIAPYGRGEETRQNDLTYVLTSNAASLDDDIAQRCYTIKLKKSKRSVNWETQTRTFIAKHRETIFAEIIAALSKPHVEIDESHTRYPEFEKVVLCAACKDKNEYDTVVASIQGDCDTANSTTDRAQEVTDVFREAINTVLRIMVSSGASTTYPTFLNTAAVSHIISTSETLRIEKIGKAEIKEMIQSGNITAISKKVSVLRTSGSSKRGYLWVDNIAISPHENTYTNIIEVEKDALVFRCCERHTFSEI